MADGDRIDEGRYSSDQYYYAWKGTDTAVATTNGVWVDARGFKRFSVHVTLGGGAATVQIRGSNAVAIPANSAHEVQIGADITADGITNVDVPLRWIKTRVSAYTSGTINANCIKTTA